GFVELDDKAPAYLPAAGNDYLFASPQIGMQVNWLGVDVPILATLRHRCEACHGAGATGIFTLGPTVLGNDPPFMILEPQANVHGWYVAGRKQEREDFKALQQQK